MASSRRFTDKLYVLLIVLCTCYLNGYAMKTDTISFSFENRRYSGLLDLPEGQIATAIIVLVPGSGKTDVVAGNAFYNTRTQFTRQGLGCIVWDKMGCGKSEGSFNYGQSPQNSASEVIAAIGELKSRHIPGSEKIGLWGISRAGWICPLVIAQYPIAFWISVSGTDEKESYGYLLEKNFLIEGRSKSQTEKLMAEWREGIRIARTGGTFEENQKATETIRNDSFYQYMNGNSVPTAEGFIKWQKTFQSGENIVEPKTELVIYVRDFDKTLGMIACPVLAIFGEKDSQVDWQKTKALYRKTIGKKPGASLTIKVLQDCNHNMLECKTGGYRENLGSYETCPGYYDAMLSWLTKQGFGH